MVSNNENRIANSYSTAGATDCTACRHSLSRLSHIFTNLDKNGKEVTTN